MPYWLTWNEAAGTLQTATVTSSSTSSTTWLWLDSTATSTASTATTYDDGDFAGTVSIINDAQLDLQRQFLAQTAPSARRYLNGLLADPQNGGLAAAYQRQQARHERQAIERMAEAVRVPAAPRPQPTEAEQRARELLLANLTPEQRATFLENDWFVVEGGTHGHRYKIHTRMGLSGNIERLDNAYTPLHRLCAHAPVGMMPHADHLLAQKLHLEHAEEDFLRVANVHARW